MNGRHGFEPAILFALLYIRANRFSGDFMKVCVLGAGVAGMTTAYSCGPPATT